ncbi:F1/F0 ATPase, subunit 2 [Syntrophus gentianae]|uniref:F1/F0 ATPase, subunit 2 n=1 Tax=Syntrophus gentianae TaxID=43775 RepID=A0A1H7VP23_9BACT|nr:ATP synthase subunit I [Syntrophus gentianae]SEM10557.1 F1/F0 ATPase, subunit 2 [Syntrophus gentianae]
MTCYGVSLIGVFVAGMVLGSFYFAVLWQTVRRLPEVSSPARLLLISLLLRMGVILPAFYLLMAGRWERIVVVLGGFVVMREILTRLWGKEKPDPLLKGAVHGHSGPE